MQIYCQVLHICGAQLHAFSVGLYLNKATQSLAQAEDAFQHLRNGLHVQEGLSDYCIHERFMCTLCLTEVLCIGNALRQD